MKYIEIKNQYIHSGIRLNGLIKTMLLLVAIMALKPVLAQTPYVEPSPNVKGFMQQINQQVDMYKGQPTLNLPLYTIQCGEIKMPISLSFDPSQVQQSTDATSIGLGWHLNAGGVISWHVKDDYDENFQNGYLNNSSAASTKPGEAYGYLENDFVVDLEMDQISYSFNGHGGTILNEIDGNSRKKTLWPDRTFAISTTSSGSAFTTAGIEIITDQGIKYTFEDIEYTNYNRLNYTPQNYSRALYLSEIEDQYGNTVEFTYADEEYIQKPPMETWKRKSYPTMDNKNDTLLIDNSGSGSLNYTLYKVKRLTQIEWNGGADKIVFSSASRSDLKSNPDASSLSPKRITDVKIYHGTSLIKGYELDNDQYFVGTDYVDGTVSSSRSDYYAYIRLKLNEITEYFNETKTITNPSYEFDYTASMGKKYYNDYATNVVNPTFSQTPNLSETEYDAFVFGSERCYSHVDDTVVAYPSIYYTDVWDYQSFSFKLDEVVYPAGGYTQYSYYSQDNGTIKEKGALYQEKQYDGEGGYTTKEYNYLRSLEIGAEHYAYIEFEIVPEYDPLGLCGGDSLWIDYFHSDDYRCLTQDYTNFWPWAEDYRPVVYRKATPIATGYSGPGIVFPEVEVIYKSSTGTNGKEKYTFTEGTISYDNADYIYADINNISYIDDGTHNGTVYTDWAFGNQAWWCQRPEHYFENNLGVGLNLGEFDYTGHTATSSGDLSLVTPTEINSSADEYDIYDVYYDNYDDDYYNMLIYPVRAIDGTWKGGKVKEKKVYNSTGTLLLKEQYEYDSDESSYTLRGTMLSKKQIGLYLKVTTANVQTFGSGVTSGTISFDYANVNHYEEEKGYLQLERKRVKQYFSGNELASKEEYEYKSDNGQLTTVKKYNISTDTTDYYQTSYCYPEDVASSCGSSTAITQMNSSSNNMIGKVLVEHTELVDGSTRKTVGLNTKEYTWDSTNGCVSKIKTHAMESVNPVSSVTVQYAYSSGVLVQNSFMESQSEMIFDSNGNLVQEQKEDDVPVTYLWGYNHSLPVAKIIGEEYDDIASYKISNIANHSFTDSDALSSIKTDISYIEGQLSTYLGDEDYQVEIYTHKPLVSSTSQTDPTGVSIYYEYDSRLRLEKILNDDEDEVSSYEYNYQN